MAPLGSTGPGLIKGCDDPFGRLGRAATVDQIENGVEVDRAVTRQLSCQAGKKTCPEQPASTPLNDLDRRSRWLICGPVDGHARVSERPRAALTSRARRKASEFKDANGA
jgi:hypothetical protein